MGAGMTVLDVLDPSRHDDSRGTSSSTGPDTDDPGGFGRDRWRRRFGRLSRPESLVTLVIVVVAVVFVFVQLQPSNLFSTSTPAGGDMGAHVWLPAYLRDHLLTHFRLTGWTPDWYGGFPALVYYFPLPMLMVVAVNVVLPYTVAFKLVSVAGLILLPVAAWAFGKLARMPFPGPGLPGRRHLALPVLPGVHDLRRQHRLHPRRRVRLLDQPGRRPALPRPGRPRAWTRENTGHGRPSP